MADVSAGSPFELGLGGHLKGNVTMALRVLERLLDSEFRPIGVSLADADVLTVLYLADGRVAAPTELASWLGLTTAGMTARLNALERQALLERHPHPSDGRRVIVQFTDAGEALAARVIARKEEVLAAQVVSELGEEASQRLVADLAELIRAASLAVNATPAV